MRIIYVTSSLPFGATEAFAVPELTELVSRGHQVLIVPVNPRGTGVRNRDAGGLVPYSLRHPVVDVEILKGFLSNAPSPSSVLAKLVEVIGVRSPKAAMKNAALLPKGYWLGGIAKTWSADHIHSYWASSQATVAMVASSVSGVPFSFTAHRYDILEANLLDSKMQAASFVRVISEDGQKLLLNQAGTWATKIRVMRLGVSVPPLVSRAPSRRMVVLCPALLIPRKRQAVLIDAVAVLRSRNWPIELQLAGDGPERNQLATQVSQLGVKDSVRFLGHVSHDKLLGMYAGGEVDAVALASVHEGVPVALMEAMAHSVPVVATSVGGVPELLEGNAGVLVSGDLAVEFANAFQRLGEDSVIREALGARGRERIREQYSLTASVTRLIEMFEGQ